MLGQAVPRARLSLASRYKGRQCCQEVAGGAQGGASSGSKLALQARPLPNVGLFQG